MDWRRTHTRLACIAGSLLLLVACGTPDEETTGDLLPPREVARLKTEARRVADDLRFLAMAIEAYLVDRNDYPAWALGPESINGTLAPDHAAGALPSFRIPALVDGQLQFASLTTPIAYLGGFPRDPFSHGSAACYVYLSVQPGQAHTAGRKAADGAWRGWILISAGPDGDYDWAGEWDELDPRAKTQWERLLTGMTAGGSAFTYDPTNGLLSDGDIWRASWIVE
jgi:hypothetical protein